jgi:hypothetical protein
MTLLIAGMALALAVGIFVVHPILFRRWGLLGDALPGQLVDREARKRVALAALKEVEYDRAAGKLDEVDYRALRSRLEGEALAALRAAEGDTVSAGTGEPRHTCGFVNPGGSRFCSGCGVRLTTS